MRKITKMSLIVLFLFTLVFTLLGCKTKEDPTKEEETIKEEKKDEETKEENIVTIKSLSGENIKETSVQENVKKRTTKRRDGFSHPKSSWDFPYDSIFLDDRKGTIPADMSQYVIMFKNETDIKFTITLDNPKGEAIDAVELTCDDPYSKILVDGEWEDIRYDDGKIILNWAQENPYKKVFKIRTTSKDDVNIVKVNNLKVNGFWQKKSLKNDKLNIYKLDESEIKAITVHNRLDYYDFKIETSENIKIKEISSDNSQASLTEEGNYRITKSGKIYIKYTYSVNGVELEWDYIREIELLRLSIYHDKDIGPKADLCSSVFDGGFTFDALGTDIDASTVYFTYKGLLFTGKRSPEYRYDGHMFYFIEGYTGELYQMYLREDEINENENIILYKLLNGDTYAVRLENGEIVFRFVK